MAAWAPGYSWSQTEDTISIIFEMAPTRNVVDVNVVFSQHELRAGVEGEPLRVVGTLHHAVLPSECTWVLEHEPGYSMVEIHLQKSVPISWPYPIKEDAGDGTPMDWQSELELARHYESAGNLESALEHIKRAADKGSAAALLTLGKLHHLGSKSPYRLTQDQDAAMSFYTQAAARGSCEGMFLKGTMLQEQGQHALAADTYKQACADSAIRGACALDRTKKGLPHYIVTSYFNLGIIYQDGSKDVPVNYDETIKWWTLAASEHFAPAIYNLGVLYLNGSGVARDEAKAFALFERAHNLNPKFLIPPRRQVAGTPATRAAAAATAAVAASTPTTAAASSFSSSSGASAGSGSVLGSHGAFGGAVGGTGVSLLSGDRMATPAGAGSREAAAAVGTPHTRGPLASQQLETPSFSPPPPPSSDDGSSSWTTVAVVAAAACALFAFMRR